MKPTALPVKLGTFLFVGLAVAALALSSLWLGGAAPAFAAAGTPPARPTPSYAGLKAGYQAEQGWLSLQTASLSAANGVAAGVQAYINVELGLQVDVSAITAALSTYETQIGSAQASHNTAAGILSSHAGFDGSGNVTDPTQAKDTLTNARQSLNDAHTTLTQADKDLHTALTQFRAVVEQARLGRERKWLGAQQTRLDDCNKIVSDMQTFISNQNAKGQDTSALAAALAAYQQQVASAQAAHTTAANLLASPAGFDGTGNVTDPNQAHMTMAQAYQSLLTAHNILDQAGPALRAALQSYRQSHKLTPAPAPSATPNS